MKNKQKAFTLSELLVVVILLGVLAAVAVPKYARVLETRKTTEAESFLKAVRTEQEQRCVFGKDYKGDLKDVKVASTAGQSKQYEYRLLKQGIAAQSRGKDYTLRLPSYKDGRMCCDGVYCSKLNKDYLACAELAPLLSHEDECAADVEEDCRDNDNQAKCCGSDEKWDGGKCVAKTFCELNPNDCTCNAYQEKCCTNEQKWDGKKCVAKTFCELNPNDCACNPDQSKCCTSEQKWDGSSCIAKTFCELNPSSCECVTYAQANPCECAPQTCACPTYYDAHPAECDPDSCEANPVQEKCCDKDTQKWDGKTCAAKTACERDDQKNTCACETYAAANPCECETTKNTCACDTYKENNPCNCDDTKTTCACKTYADENACECNPCTENCCDDPLAQYWDGAQCLYAEAGEPPVKTQDCECGKQTASFVWNKVSGVWDFESWSECDNSLADTCQCPAYAQANKCECDASYAAANKCECDSSYAQANKCECDASYAQQNACECTPNTCACEEYEISHPCECYSDYAEANRCECAPSTETCCNPAWEVYINGRCVSKNSCEFDPNRCDCEPYRAAHPCECDGICSCEEDPAQSKCHCGTLKVWDEAANACVCKNSCDGGATQDPDTCKCQNPQGTWLFDAIGETVTLNECFSSHFCPSDFYFGHCQYPSCSSLTCNEANKGVKCMYYTPGDLQCGMQMTKCEESVHSTPEYPEMCATYEAMVVQCRYVPYN